MAVARSAEVLFSGGWRPRRDHFGAVGAYLLFFLGTSMFPGFMGYTHWAEAEALRRQWTAVGPPCPRVQTPAPWAVSRRRPPKVVDYGGVRFTRSFAAISCAAIPEPGLLVDRTYTVCDFNNPGLVTVAPEGGRTLLFQPPPGRGATVTVRDGRVRCVLGERYRL